MKPFDLEKAKAGAPLVTRDGRPAKFIAYVPELPEEFRVYAFLEKEKALRGYHADGYYGDGESGYDLFMALEKKTGFVNIYKRGDNPPFVGNLICKSVQHAEEYENLRLSPGKLIAIAVPISWEE